MHQDVFALSVLDILTSIAERRRRDEHLELHASEITVERPRDRAHGDWSTNAAMKFAKRLGMNPRELAQEIVGGLSHVDGIASADVAGPGFVNIRLDTASAGRLAKTIVDAGPDYGRGDAFAGQKINLEFVSANPTGPIHLGGTRWAAVGDSLARLLSSQKGDVTREYYFNDHGAQIDRFARSLVAAHRGEPTPEDGYGGSYIGEIAQRVARSHSGEALDDMTLEALTETFRATGVDFMFGDIKQSLRDFGVHFDVYFHENQLHESGAVTRAVDRLRSLGQIFEKDGAVWLRTTAFGDDKDRVVIKSDGQPAYVSGDLAYYLDKRERGFDRCLVMLGADHHGYVQRLMAMCSAFGDEPGINLQVLIGQMVNLVRDGDPVRMSKRAGTVVTLEDLVEIVGVDAARYALVRSSADSNLDIDLDLLEKRSNDNPVFYVQYAHARTTNVARRASDEGVTRSEFQPQLLEHDTESALLGALQDFPRIVRFAAESREPYRVAHYLEELAGLYHRWYGSCRVTPLGDAPIEPVHSTRLWLNDASGQVFRNGLDLLGVSAPERM
ncbi:arginine--tRNA ligase [Brachybacterium sp.]|uniref:arginine--tRNA ligase n=1 Tax=Brachybacterium sp. TaxID=1891286 RepID=UPI002ED0FD80